ncbi:hypothetical protein BJX99DRAFT_52249 [Aspergillus californicus]
MGAASEHGRPDTHAAIDSIGTPHEIGHDRATTSQETALRESAPHAAINPSQEGPREISRDPATDPHATPQKATSPLQEQPHGTSHEASKTDQDTPPYNPLITIPGAVDIIHKFSTPLYETPQHVYVEIVRSIQERVDIQQSDDRTWKNIVETSFFKTQKHKILTLLEYIGASDWFDKQISTLQQSCLTKKGQPIESSTAAGRVLNNIWKEHNLHLGKIPCKMQKEERARIWSQLHRGRDLRNQIVKHLGVGILFSPSIWSLINMASKQLDITINLILATPEQMMLLRLLDKQIEYMVNTGSTDPDTFHKGLKEHGLVSEQEFMDFPAMLPIHKENGVGTQVEDLESLHDSSQTGPASNNPAATPQNQHHQITEPNFNVFKDDETSSIIGFEFENVIITSEDISDIKENSTTVRENITAIKENIPHVRRRNHWLTISHIRLFCLYLRVNLLRGDCPGRIHFFCPLTVGAFKEGWESILDSEGPQIDENHILSAHYLVFPLVTDENDHWFTVIVSSQGGLANAETPTVYILDSSWYEWKSNLQESIKQIITKAMAGSTAVQSATVQFYEATEGTLPQQSQELCGYYLMLYLELLAADPDALLTRIKEFNAAETRMDYIFEPGNMDGELAERFAELIEDFQYAEQRQDHLVAKSGRLMFKGDLRYLARGVNFI